MLQNSRGLEVNYRAADGCTRSIPVRSRMRYFDNFRGIHGGTLWYIFLLVVIIYRNGKLCCFKVGETVYKFGGFMQW